MDIFATNAEKPWNTDGKTMSGCRQKYIWLHTPGTPGGVSENKYFAQSAESLAEREEFNMKKIPEWIYMPINLSPELEKTFEAVEKALGFKLFIWQKTFIAYGTYRKSGRTTAEILRDLLDVSKPPLDYTKPVTNHMERLYREETRQIKAKLDAAGIPTRIIFFSQQEKQNYYSKTEAQAAGRKARF